MGCARVHHHRAVSHRLNPQAHHFLLLQEGVPLRAMQFYDAQGLLRGNLSRLETVVGLSVAEGSPTLHAAHSVVPQVQWRHAHHHGCGAAIAATSTR